MTEWLTPGATAVVGYLGGLITKPIQNRWEERRQAQRLRKALYVEISGIIAHCQYTLDSLRRDQSITTFWEVYADKMWPCRCYESAKQMPVVLNLLPDIIGINHFYSGLEALSDAHKEAREQAVPNVWCILLFLRLIGNMVQLVNKNELSKAELTRAGDERTRRFLLGLPDLEDLTEHYKRMAEAESRQ